MIIFVDKKNMANCVTTEQDNGPMHIHVLHVTHALVDENNWLPRAE
jgi:hypothetical protein